MVEKQSDRNTREKLSVTLGWIFTEASRQRKPLIYKNTLAKNCTSGAQEQSTLPTRMGRDHTQISVALLLHTRGGEARACSLQTAPRNESGRHWLRRLLSAIRNGSSPVAATPHRPVTFGAVGSHPLDYNSHHSQPTWPGQPWQGHFEIHSISVWAPIKPQEQNSHPEHRAIRTFIFCPGTREASSEARPGPPVWLRRNPSSSQGLLNPRARFTPSTFLPRC